LVYDGSDWINSAITSVGASEQWVTDNFLSANTSYYTQGEADDNFLSASTILVDTLSGLTDTTLNNIQSGETIVYDNGEWINSAITSTGGASETWVTDNFLSANTSLFDGDYNSLINQPTLFTEAEADANYLSANTILVEDLTDLGDVTITTPTTDQILAYDGTNWINSANTASPVDLSNYYTSGETDANFLSASTILTTTLSGLTDTDINVLVDNQTLIYDSSSSKWENKDVAIVEVINPQSGETLIYDNGEWINSATTSVSNYYTSGETDANFLSANTSLFDGDYNSLTNQPTLFTEAEADANYLSASTILTTTLSGLTDTNLNTIVSGETIVYNNGEWINSATTSVGGTASNGMNLNVDNFELGGELTKDTTIGSMTAGNIKRFHVQGKADGTAADFDDEYHLNMYGVSDRAYAELYVKNSISGYYSGMKSSTPNGLTSVSYFGNSSVNFSHQQITTGNYLKINGTHLDYNGDYSSSYNNRSLVDKEYVDSQLFTSENGITIINDKIRLGGDLMTGTTINLSSNTFSIEGLSATTTYEDSSLTTIISDGSEEIKTELDIDNYSLVLGDTSNSLLSFINVNLTSGITISSNTSGTTQKTNFIKLNSEYTQIDSDTGSGTKILMTATDGITQFYLTVTSGGVLTTTAV